MQSSFHSSKRLKKYPLLGRRQKERLKDIQIQACTSLDPHPADVFELYKEEMQAQLQDLFMPAYQNSPFYQAL
jgi:hypothetical protein